LRIWAAPATMTACNPRGTRPAVHRFRLAAMATIALERGRFSPWRPVVAADTRSTSRSFPMADLTEHALSCSLRRNDHRGRPRYNGHRSRPLTCRFAPLAGLEPAPYGLEVRHDPSGWWPLGASPQVALSLPSAWLHPGWHDDNDQIANGIASPHGRPQVNLRPNDWTPPRPGSTLSAVRCRGRDRQRTTAARRRPARSGSADAARRA
jgi:hypothetical protein